MKMTAEEKRKRTIAVVLGGLALLLVMYRMYDVFWGGPTAPVAVPVAVVAAPPVRPSAAGRPVTSPPGFAVGAPTGTAIKLGSGAQLDPTLHMEGMLLTESLVYSGTGRNIFASGPTEAPVKLIAAAAPARPALTPVIAVAPPRDPGPPAPPPINLKFFGTATSQNGTRRAFLLNGDDVFLASAGDVVQRRYRVLSIAANSILVEDIPTSSKQTLPLMGN
jgi:hypothetical protein